MLLEESMLKMLMPDATCLNDNTYINQKKVRKMGEPEKSESKSVLRRMHDVDDWILEATGCTTSLPSYCKWFLKTHPRPREQSLKREVKQISSHTISSVIILDVALASGCRYPSNPLRASPILHRHKSYKSSNEAAATPKSARLNFKLSLPRPVILIQQEQKEKQGSQRTTASSPPQPRSGSEHNFHHYIQSDYPCML